MSEHIRIARNGVNADFRARLTRWFRVFWIFRVVGTRLNRNAVLVFGDGLPSGFGMPLVMARSYASPASLPAEIGTNGSEAALR